MMAGRLGRDVDAFFQSAKPDHLRPIKPMPQFWAELAWAAENEAVVHLDDLLLRRVRTGILLEHGGMDKISTIREIIQEPLGWSDQTWEEEFDRYQSIWRKYYTLPNV